MKSRRGLKIAAILAVALVGAFAFTPSERYFEIQKNLDIFVTMFKEVNAYYVDEVDPEELITTGIEAMLESLDPYTNYIPEDNLEDYRTMTTNQYGGIGALINRIGDRILVAMPHEGFPAFESGLRVGDEIVKIDGVDVRGKSTQDVSKLLKGKARTDVEVEVKRYNQPEVLKFTLTRQRITIDNVSYYGKLTEKIGYIRLSDFTTEATKEVKQAIQELKKDGAESLVLDLRGNPGGLLNEAINISNLFIDKGSDVVSTKGKVTEWNKTYKALNSPLDTRTPLVVLTSNGSASASEIVAGVIQDYDRGVLVGRKTFGKGLVQATRPLTYNSQLKITTAKYYIPSGRCIQSIDYSLRDENGDVEKVPDSLKMEFKTRNGRSVYDGGGIDPDVEVKVEFLSPLTTVLIRDGLIFDYATKYRYDHPNITDPDNFSIDDKEYDEFAKWLSDKDYEYESKLERELEELTEAAKSEELFELIKDEIESLKTRIAHNKNSDLIEFKEEIKRFLEEQIVAHYYLEDGKIRSSLRSDPDVKKAIEVLKNQNQYEQLLAVN